MLEVVPTLMSLSQRFSGAIFYLVVISTSLLCIAGWNETWLTLLFSYGLFLAFQADSGGILTTLKVAIIFIGFATTAGLLAGLLNVRLVGESNSRYLLLVLLLITMNVYRKRQNFDFEDKDLITRYISFSLAATAGVILFLLSTSPNVFGWLLNTWDGATQPGVVTVIWGQGHIDYVGDIPTGYEGYPRAIHFVEAWLTSTLNDFVYSPKLTVSFFALINIVVYLSLVFALHAFARGLFRISSRRVSNGYHSLSLFLLALVILSPFFVQGLFFHHSINFWVSLICILVSSSICLDLAREETSVRNKMPATIDRLTITASIVIVSHSYQILLPIAFFIGLFFVALQIKSRIRTDFRTQHLTALNSLSLVISTIALFNWFNYPSSEGNRLTFTGALTTVPIEMVVVCLFVTWIWIWCCDRQRSWKQIERYFLPLFFLGITFCWLALWLMSGSFDRSPGLNYYPKKFEYALVIILLPFFATGTAMLFSIFFQKIVQRSWIKFYAIGMSLATLYWGLTNLAKPIQDLNRAFSSISDAAIKETNIEGPSTIVGESGHISLAGSFLSNTLDLSFWRNPHPDVPLYHYGGNIIGNSGVVEDIKLCEITDILGGPSRVYDLSRDIRYECWK
jgi:hypothetical protein